MTPGPNRNGRTAVTLASFPPGTSRTRRPVFPDRNGRNNGTLVSLPERPKGRDPCFPTGTSETRRPLFPTRNGRNNAILVSLPERPEGRDPCFSPDRKEAVPPPIGPPAAPPGTRQWFREWRARAEGPQGDVLPQRTRVAPSVRLSVLPDDAHARCSSPAPPPQPRASFPPEVASMGGGGAVPGWQEARCAASGHPGLRRGRVLGPFGSLSSGFPPEAEAARTRNAP